MAASPPAARSAGSSAARWELTPAIEAELAEVAAAAGCELLHAEWKGGVLRLVLDRPDAPPDAQATPAPGVAAPASPAPPPDHAPPAAPGPAVAGVSLGDCEHVAKQASALLDVLDFGNGRYLLEVSSPGLDRQLYRPGDYRRFLGRLARVTYELPAPPAPGGEGGPGAASGAAAPFAPSAPRGSRAARPAPAARGTRRTIVARLADFQAAPAGPEAAAAAPAPAAVAAAPSAPSAPSDNCEVTLVDDKTGERLTLPLAAIRLARLEVEL